MLGHHLPSSDLVRSVADDRLSHGEKTFGFGLGALTLTMAGVLAASLLRHFGIC